MPVPRDTPARIDAICRCRRLLTVERRDHYYASVAADTRRDTPLLRHYMPVFMLT